MLGRNPSSNMSLPTSGAERTQRRAQFLLARPDQIVRRPRRARLYGWRQADMSVDEVGTSLI